MFWIGLADCSNMPCQHIPYPNIHDLDLFVGFFCQVAASKMEVKAMPTFVFLKEEAQVDKLVGANPEELRKRIENFALSNRSYN